MTEKRIIKKYPNRRLYDTEISRYITLEDVKGLVLEGIDFTVIDVKTNDDLTRNILIQIIAEQEHGEHPIFSANALTRIIHSYGKSNQFFLSDYLNKCLEIYEQQQSAFQDHIRQISDSIDDMSEMTESNIKFWKRITDNFFKSERILPSETETDKKKN